MGTYLNPGSDNFQRSIQSEIYVDKTGLLAYTNRRINTQQCYLCVSRPRRFGKSMAANMLAAYYGSGEQTEQLFKDFEIYQHPTFSQQINRYLVLKLDVQSFMSETGSVQEMTEKISHDLIQELTETYPDAEYLNQKEMARVMASVYAYTRQRFVVLIDEWDCVMRRYHTNAETKHYLDFLRNFIKDQPYIALAYMTGILPVKKYGEHSTLNMFDEFSMLRSYGLAPYFGFTEDEVYHLCSRYHMDFETAKDWYDGYHFTTTSKNQPTVYSMYSPKSVVDAMLNETFDTYWTQTESYEALRDLIELNYDGLRDAIVDMLAENAVSVNTRSFQNDMNVFHSKDDVLTLLVHLGYLSYNREEQTVVIPNKEVAEEFVSSIAQTTGYGEVYQALTASKSLLEALWRMDEEVVAAGVEKAHMQFSALQYNGENALSCVIELAFYYAREYYQVFRELPTGIGFADICFLPKVNHADKPAVIIELKWDSSAEGAIQQIKDRKYPERLYSYRENMLLCGISYQKGDITQKKHSCVIEKLSWV